MSTIVSPIRAYPLLSFVVLACLFGWVLFIAAVLGAGVTPTGMPLGPIMAAAIVAAGMGRAELREWGRQVVTLRASPGWYALAGMAPVAIIVVAMLANHLFGAPLPQPSQLAAWTDLPGTFVVLLITVGIGEEAGWTAFAAPRLLGRHTFITAWVALSAMRILWHIPLMLSGDLPWVLGVGGNAAFQLLILWIFRRSGGVWFLAAVWHAVLNTAGGAFFFPMVQGQDQARLGVLMTVGYALVAGVVYLLDRRNLGGDPAALTLRTRRQA